MIDKKTKIYIAGHKGMVGAAIWRQLEKAGYTHLLGKTSKELDLRNQDSVHRFFEVEKPEVVIDAAARVGGILANNTYPYQFLMDNMTIQNNLIDAALNHEVEKFIFLGSSCIYPKLAPQPLKEEYLLTGSLEPTNEWYAVAKITGIKAADIYQVARDFMAYAPQAIYYQGRRTTWSKNDFQLRRAQAIFSALGGGIDVKGGICFGKSLPIAPHEVAAPMYAQAKPRIEKDEAAVVGGSGSWVAFRNMVLENRSPYPIRALFNYKHNPMQNMPNNKKTEEFLKKLDLVVTIDTMPSDTVMLSDVILPECT